MPGGDNGGSGGCDGRRRKGSGDDADVTSGGDGRSGSHGSTNRGSGGSNRADGQ